MQPLPSSPTPVLTSTATGVITTTLFGDRSTLSFAPNTQKLTWVFTSIDTDLRITLAELSPAVVVQAAIDANILNPCAATRTLYKFNRPAGTPNSNLMCTHSPCSYLLRCGAKLEMAAGGHVRFPVKVDLRVSDPTPHRKRPEHHLMMVTANIGDHARFDAKLTFAHMLYALATMNVLEVVACPIDAPVTVRLPRAMR